MFNAERYKIIKLLKNYPELSVIIEDVIKQTNNLINNSKDSYIQIRQAGEYMKANTDKNAVIITSSPPQMAVYSERKIMPMKGTAEEINQIRKGREERQTI